MKRNISVVVLALVVAMSGCAILGIKQVTPTEAALEAAVLAMGFEALTLDSDLSDVDKARALLAAGNTAVQKRGFTSFLDLVSAYAATISQDRWTPDLQAIVDFILKAFDDAGEDYPEMEPLRALILTE